MYIKETLSYTIRDNLVPVRLEMICIEINNVYNRPFLLGTWYRPPNSDIGLFDDCASFLEKCDYESRQLIILGDMNCDYSRSPIGPHTERLQFLSSMYQFQQLILEPTRLTDKSSTLIDLAFTNEISNIAKSGVIHCGMSDHSIIVVVRKVIPH